VIHNFYTLWAPFYDWFAGPKFRDLRREAVAALDLKSGERLMISGVGTGLDFEFLPRYIGIVACDLNESMLRRARQKADRLGVVPRLEVADAQALPYNDASFDAAYLPCIVCVAPDGGKVLAEALRVVKKGGRVVVIDKFLAEGQAPSSLRTLLDAVLGVVVSHVNRRWSEVAAGATGFKVEKEIPGPFKGFFRLYVLRKT